MTYRFVSDSALRVVQVGILTEAVVRGLNYIATPSQELSLLYDAADKSMPLWCWGLIFILFGVTGLLGELWMSTNGTSVQWSHRAWPSYLAHTGLMVLFGAFAFSAAAGVIARDGFYGFVTPYDFLFFAIAHWAYARRRKHV